MRHYLALSGQGGKHSQDKKKHKGCFVLPALCSGVVLIPVSLFWPQLLPIRVGDLWQIRCTLHQSIQVLTIGFSWAVVLQGLLSLFTKNKPEVNENAELVLSAGIGISLWAGLMEEICFRWLIFLGGILGAKLTNVCSFGLVAWIQIHWFGPFGNWLTFGCLKEYLVGAAVWPISAAITVANNRFSDGHEHQGTIGLINSWYIGMFFFWITLHYGLPLAILTHVCYDLTVFGISYLDHCYERAREREQCAQKRR